MFEWWANARMRLCACAGSCESAHFAHARSQWSLKRPIVHTVDLSIQCRQVIHRKHKHRCLGIAVSVMTLAKLAFFTNPSQKHAYIILPP